MPDDRSRPRERPRDSEGAIGLEVARLFGLSPRLLVAPRSRPGDLADDAAGIPPGSGEKAEEAGPVGPVGGDGGADERLQVDHDAGDT